MNPIIAIVCPSKTITQIFLQEQIPYLHLYINNTILSVFPRGLGPFASPFFFILLKKLRKSIYILLYLHFMDKQEC